MIATTPDQQETQIREFPLPPEILDIVAAGHPGAGWLTRNKTDLFICAGIGIIALEGETDAVSEPLRALFNALKVGDWYGFDVPGSDEYEGENDDIATPTVIVLDPDKPKPPVLRDLLVWALESCHTQGVEACPVPNFPLRQPSASLFNARLLGTLLMSSTHGMHQVHYVEFSKLPALLVTRCGTRTTWGKDAILTRRPRLVGLLLEMVVKEK